MTLVLLGAIKLAVVGMILAIGLATSLADVAAQLRRPGLLARSLLAIYLAVPAVTILACLALPLPDGFKLALVVLAASGGAPLLPQKLTRLGNRPYVFTLVLLSSLVAVVVVPLWFRLLAHLLAVDSVLTPADVAGVLAKSFLLPLAAGIAIRAFAPDFAKRWSERILSIFGMVLVAAGLGLLGLHLPVLLTAGWLPLLVLVLFCIGSLGIGHALGGPDPADRTALAVLCSTRHVGVVALLASAVPGPRTLVLLLAYVLAASLVSIPYLAWHAARIRGVRQ